MLQNADVVDRRSSWLFLQLPGFVEVIVTLFGSLLEVESVELRGELLSYV